MEHNACSVFINGRSNIIAAYLKTGALTHFKINLVYKAIVTVEIDTVRSGSGYLYKTRAFSPVEITLVKCERIIRYRRSQITLLNTKRSGFRNECQSDRVCISVRRDESVKRNVLGLSVSILICK